jgi:glycosyltransferase involved in cell wall biosynthesis
VTLTAVIPVHGSEYKSRKENLKEIINSATQVKLVIVADAFNQSDAASLAQLVSEGKFLEIDLIHGIFGNPGGARNAGLEIVDSEWVCFWDSDDIPNPDGFKTIIEKAEKANASVAKGRYRVLDTRNGQTFANKGSYISNDNPARHLLDPGIWRYAFSKKIYSKNRFPPLRMGEDQDFLVKVLISQQEVFQSDEMVYTYRLGNDTQITHSEAAFLDVAESLKYLRKLLGEYKKDQIGSTIVLTSYIKQLVTGVTRVGFRKSGIKPIPIMRFLFLTFLRGSLSKPVRIYVGEWIFQR